MAFFAPGSVYFASRNIAVRYGTWPLRGSEIVTHARLEEIADPPRRVLVGREMGMMTRIRDGTEIRSHGLGPTTIRFAPCALHRSATSSFGRRKLPIFSTYEPLVRTPLKRPFLFLFSEVPGRPGKGCHLYCLQRSNFKAASREHWGNPKVIGVKSTSRHATGEVFS